jgi:hypothetical protein
MAVKCVTCTRSFKNIHALKSHQPKCRGRADAHIYGLDKRLGNREGKQKNNPGHKLARGIYHDVNGEEVAREREELRGQDVSEPERTRKIRHEVSTYLMNLNR